MGWEQRLREMILAGGTLAAAACSKPVEPNNCCNASGDPCCAELCDPNATPSTPACEQEKECLDRGGGSIAASDYDQSCSVDSDCVGITAGDLCGAGCNYVNDAINVADEQKYQSDVSSKVGGTDQPWCPGQPWPAACYAGACAMAFGLPSADAETEAAVGAGPDTGADASTSDAADAAGE
jgi:hypothetical protein